MSPVGGSGDTVFRCPLARTAKIASLRSHVRESFGKVVMAMMMLPRYRQQTLADLQHLVLEPLIRGRIAIAQRAGRWAGNTQ
jgi:cytolysin-activating lysine-acyltransferase